MGVVLVTVIGVPTTEASVVALIGSPGDNDRRNVSQLRVQAPVGCLGLVVNTSSVIFACRGRGIAPLNSSDDVFHREEIRDFEAPACPLGSPDERTTLPANRWRLRQTTVQSHIGHRLRQPWRRVHLDYQA